jgi:NADH dehydrogenase
MPIAFVAGATGYTGRALLVELPRLRSAWTARPHARKPGALPDAVVCDPRDVAALTGGMRGCDAVVQLIGTVRANFGEGDYEAIDYGTTVALGTAAKAAGVPRLLLLSSVGAASGRGSYLGWKKKTEDWVIGSGLEYTIVRPSAIVGAGRRAMQVGLSFLRPVPSLRPIEVHQLADVFVRALERRDQVRNRVLEGRSLWKLLEA